jgi:hypothetical protein
MNKGSKLKFGGSGGTFGDGGALLGRKNTSFTCQDVFDALQSGRDAEAVSARSRGQKLVAGIWRGTIPPHRAGQT